MAQGGLEHLDLGRLLSHNTLAITDNTEQVIKLALKTNMRTSSDAVLKDIHMFRYTPALYKITTDIFSPKSTYYLQPNQWFIIKNYASSINGIVPFKIGTFSNTNAFYNAHISFRNVPQ